MTETTNAPEITMENAHMKKKCRWAIRRGRTLLGYATFSTPWDTTQFTFVPNAVGKRLGLWWTYGGRELLLSRIRQIVAAPASERAAIRQLMSD